MGKGVFVSESYDTLGVDGLPVRILNSSVTQGNVSKELVAALRESQGSDSGILFIITHTTLENISSIINDDLKSSYGLIIDEEIKVINAATIVDKEEGIGDYLELFDFTDTRDVQVNPCKLSLVSRIATKACEFTKFQSPALADICKAARSPYKTLHSLTALQPDKQSIFFAIFTSHELIAGYKEVALMSALLD